MLAVVPRKALHNGKRLCATSEAASPQVRHVPLFFGASAVAHVILHTTHGSVSWPQDHDLGHDAACMQRRPPLAATIMRPYQMSCLLEVFSIEMVASHYQHITGVHEPGCSCQLPCCCCLQPHVHAYLGCRVCSTNCLSPQGHHWCPEPGCPWQLPPSHCRLPHPHAAGLAALAGLAAQRPETGALYAPPLQTASDMVEGQHKAGRAARR